MMSKFQSAVVIVQLTALRLGYALRLERTLCVS